MSRREVKLYGGPAHGERWPLSDTYGCRLEVVTQYPVPFNPWLRVDDPVVYEAADRVYNTYHIQQWHRRAFTERGSEVRQSVLIGLLEGGQITSREYHDLELDMDRLPWEWVTEPSFLYQFERWWEWRLHVNGIKLAKIRGWNC